MADYQRLVDYIQNYFPDPSHSQTDIKRWAKKSVPAWKNMSKGTKDGILEDWDKFINPIPQAKFDRPRDKRGRFRRTAKSYPKVSGSDRARDSKGRFTKFASNVNGKVKKFLGRSY